VVIATGAIWRKDGVGHVHTLPIEIDPDAQVLSPGDVMDGQLPAGKRVLIWDDDHYYMAGVLAELLAGQGYDVLYATPASEASTWTRLTMEQHFIQKRPLEQGVAVKNFTVLDRVGKREATLACTFTGRQERIEADAVVLVTARLPKEDLLVDLQARSEEWADAGLEQVSAIGDALAPATNAHAIYAGRRYAEELDGDPLPEGAVPFRREIKELIEES